MVMPQHPDPVIRRAVRVLSMVGELHRRGYQKLRVMPFMSPGGTAWRCWIGPDTLSYRDHGAYLRAAVGCWEEAQSSTLTACYATGADHYFGWEDAGQDDARTLADKFLTRFTTLAGRGEGWSYTYAGWYQRLLGLAERGWMPVVLDDSSPFLRTKIPLQDVRPTEWRTENDQTPSLPLPPAGKLQEDVPYS
ncbi:hypothetical protein ACVWZV_009631 [Bradyrhizobium sp. GM5.1]